MPGDGFMALSHSGSAAASSRAGRVGVYLVPEGHYCARVNTVQAYGDVNREVRGWWWLGQHGWLGLGGT
jgi:hypothetical protein